MKRFVKKFLKSCVSGFIILAMLPFSILAYAEDLDYLSYEIVDGAVTITDCDTNASGILTIPETIEGYKVMTIGDSAFQSCKKLTEVVIPSSVTTIERWAFVSCEALQKMNMPDSITSVGVNAFCNCFSLSDIYISKGLKTLENSVFSSCESLEFISIPRNITKIMSAAFFHCKSLKVVTIPKEVEFVDSDSFSCCEELSQIVVESKNPNYSSDSYGALYNKDKSRLIWYPIGNLREEYSVNEKTTEIGTGAFEYAKYLKTVTLPEGLTKIEITAFDACVNLDRIFIPKNVTKIASRAFRNSVKQIDVDVDNATYCNDSDGVLYNKDMTELVIFPNRNPLTQYTINVKTETIGSFAFEYNTNLKTVTIPENIKKINSHAFANCKRLSEIHIPESVTEIGDSAFSYCESLTSINLPNNIGNIASGLFDGCSSLKTIDIPKSVSAIGSSAFSSCSLTSIVIPNSVYAIGPSAFAYSALQSITIPDSVRYIDQRAFEYCHSLQKVVIGNSVGELKGEVFSYCSSLTYLTIPCSAETDANAFRGCNNIKSVRLTRGTGESFEYWTRTSSRYDKRPWKNSLKTLEKVVIEEGVRSICKNAFRECANLREVSISSSVTKIKSYAFRNCKNLFKVNISSAAAWCGVNFADSAANPLYYARHLYLNDKLITDLAVPKGVTAINDYAFYYATDIKNIELPDGITSIGKYAFRFTGFYNDSSNWEDGVLYIGDYLIDTNDALGNAYVVKDGTKTIAANSFANKIGLKAVLLPDTVGYLNSEAFSGCSNLLECIIADNVINIGTNIFLNCSTEFTVLCYKNSFGSESNYVYETLGSNYNYVDYSFDITLDSQGGNIGKTTQNIKKLRTFKDIKAPTKDGVIFGGWYFSPNGGERCEDNTIIGKDLKIIGEGTVSFTKTFYAHWIKSISIEKSPDKTDYFVGENIDLSGMKLKVFYDNGDVEIVDSGLNIKKSTTSSAGKQLVTVNYKGATTDFTVNVSDVEAQTLSIKSEPNKLSYYVGEKLDLEGLSPVLGFNNGEERELIDGYTVDKVDMSVPGTKTVTIRYGDMTAEFEIEVQDIVSVKAEISSLPSKMDYYVGDLLNTEDFSLRVTYNNGCEAIVTEGYNCTPNVLNKNGNQTIDVDYEGLTTSFNVCVNKIEPVELRIKKLPNRVKYYVGDKLQPKGISVSLKYNNSIEKDMTDLTNLDFEYDFATAGKQKVKVSYSENGKIVHSEFSVDVFEPEKIYSEELMTVNSGETISVPFYISNNNGISGFHFKLTYDSQKLVPVAVNGGSVLSLSQNDSAISILESDLSVASSDNLNVIWSSTENVCTDGLLFTVDFKANNSVSGETSIDIEYVSDDCFDENGDEVKFLCSGTKVQVEYSESVSKPTIKLENVNAEPGSMISIPIKAYNLPATQELEINVSYNKNIFTLVDVDFLLENACEYKIRSNGVRIIISDLQALSGKNLCVLKLNTSNDAYGDYDLTISAENVDNSTDIVAEGCKVFVKSETTVYSDDLTLSKDMQTLEIPIYIKNNHGIMGYGLYLNYDSTLFSIEKVSRGSALADGNFDYNVVSDGRLFVSWFNSTNICDNGEIFKLTLSIINYKPVDTQITISLDQENTFNENWENVYLNCQNVLIKGSVGDVLHPKAGSTTVIEKGRIYGLNAGVMSLEDYIEVDDGYTLEYSKKIGTGTIVKVLLDGVTVKEYTVLIFGDVNGDGWYDGQDAVMVELIACGMFTADGQVGELLFAAADCDHSGSVDQQDIEILQKAGILIQNVNQTSSNTVFETQAYIEYSNVIDQLPNETDNYIGKFLESLIMSIKVLFLFIVSIIKI